MVVELLRSNAKWNKSRRRGSAFPISHFEFLPMRALDLKLIRDVGKMKGQMVAVGLVMACGLR